jgi:DNA-binding CsgD family transcriptional regulator
MPLLRRHAADQRHAPATAEDFEERLLAIAPDLTTREREVCALIALGVSSEGIGLRLGISLNTVRTYRKRAYTRLRISSHNELLRLACQRPTAN